MTEDDSENQHAPIEARAIEALVIEPKAITLDLLKLRLATQVAPVRWMGSLEAIARKVEGGETLEHAIAGTRGPRELQCLLSESLNLPDPTRFVLDAIRGRSEVRASWSNFVSLVSYPLALFVVAVLIGAVFSYVTRGIVDFTGMEEFGLSGFATVKANIDDQHAALTGAAMVIGWVTLVLLTIAVVGPPWAWTAVMGGVVIIGRPLRWVSLQEILHRYHLFADQGVADGNIGRAVARSFNRSSQAVVAASVAQRIEAGMPIGRSLAQSMLSDGLCRPALLLLDEPGTQASAGFLRTARLLGLLAEQRCRVLGMIMPVLLILMVGTVIWATISCYIMMFLPLVNMISALS